MDQISKHGGKLDGDLIVHLHYPPCFKAGEAPNTAVPDIDAPTINMLRRFGFKGDNAFVMDTCPRRQPYTIQKDGKEVPFNVFQYLDEDHLHACLQYVNDIYTASQARFVLLCGKPNWDYFGTHWTSQNRFQAFHLYGRHYDGLRIWVIYIDSSRTRIQRIVLPCPHPSSILKTPDLTWGGDYDRRLACISQMAGITGRTDQERTCMAHHSGPKYRGKLPPCGGGTSLPGGVSGTKSGSFNSFHR